jgi:hypothetical protein
MCRSFHVDVLPVPAASKRAGIPLKLARLVVHKRELAVLLALRGPSSGRPRGNQFLLTASCSPISENVINHIGVFFPAFFLQGASSPRRAKSPRRWYAKPVNRRAVCPSRWPQPLTAYPDLARSEPWSRPLLASRIRA